MLKLLAFVLPLGLDSFVVAAAIGAAGVAGRRVRLRVSAVFVTFEAGMPLIGLAAGTGQIGSLVSERIREHAEQVAGVVLISLGCYLVVERAII